MSHCLTVIVAATNLKNKFEYLHYWLPFIDTNNFIFMTDKTKIKYDIGIDDRVSNVFAKWKTLSPDIADVVIYGHIHHPYMDKIYNKTIINVGSVGNSFDVMRNKNKDSDVLETTKSNYIIIEEEYGSKEYSSDISFQFIKVPYDIDMELEDENLNIEKDNKILMVKEAKKKF